MPLDDFFEKLRKHFPGGNPEQRRIKFEEQLFRAGKLEFHKADISDEARGYLSSLDEWYGYPEVPIVDSTELLLNERNRHGDRELWQRRFSGKIPLQWSTAVDVVDDLQLARKKGIALSRVLVDAAASHPDQIVVDAVGKNQKLTIRQLAWIFTHPAFIDAWDDSVYSQRYFHFRDIIETQRKLGVTEKEIEKAQEIAQDLYRKHYHDHESPNKNEKNITLSNITVEHTEKTKRGVLMRGTLFITYRNPSRTEPLIWALHKNKGEKAQADVLWPGGRKKERDADLVEKYRDEIIASLEKHLQNNGIDGEKSP